MTEDDFRPNAPLPCRLLLTPKQRAELIAAIKSESRVCGPPRPLIVDATEQSFTRVTMAPVSNPAELLRQAKMIFGFAHLACKITVPDDGHEIVIEHSGPMSDGLRAISHIGNAPIRHIGVESEPTVNRLQLAWKEAT